MGMKTTQIFSTMLALGAIFLFGCSSEDDAPAPPSAGFSSDVQEILAGRTVTFTDNSTDAPVQWFWTFEGGTPEFSDAQNPEVIYTERGVYDVSLIVSNELGADSIIMESFITVCEGVISISDDEGTYDGILSFNADDDVTGIDLDGSEVAVDYDSEGRLESISFMEGSDENYTVRFDYDAEGVVEHVFETEPGRVGERKDYTHTTNADGSITVTEVTYAETSEGSGEYELTNSSAEYTIVDGNVTAFEFMETEDGQSTVTESGTVTYGASDWRPEHAALFDLTGYPLIFNENLFEEVSVSDNQGVVRFRGEASAETNAENEEIVTFVTRGDDDSSETTRITTGRACE